VYIYRYVNRKNLKFNDIKIYEYSLKNNSIVMEAFFKNGNLYTTVPSDKKYVPPYRNYVFLNIFNPAFLYETDINILVFPYILNYIYQNENIVLSQLYEFLGQFIDLESKEFKKIIQDAILTYFEYSYIKIEYKNKLDINDETLEIKSTEKLKIVMEYSLYDINVLQSYIYGAMIKKEYLENLEFYDNRWKNYWSITLKNTIIFLYFIEKLEENIKIEEKYKLNLTKNDRLKNEFYKMYHQAKDSLGSNFKLNFNGEMKEEFNNLYNNFISEMIYIKEEIKNIEYKDFERIFKSLKDKEDRIYLLKIIDIKNKEIVENYYLHKFVFGGFYSEKIDEFWEELEHFSSFKHFMNKKGLIKNILDILNPNYAIKIHKFAPIIYK